MPSPIAETPVKDESTRIEMMHRVLLVEDSPTKAGRLRLELESDGLAVAQASDGEEGLALARLEPPDVILSDVLMPRMDGFELCRQIRLDPGLRHLPVVLMSATFVSEKDRAFALEAGADEIIEQPSPHVRLSAILNDVTSRRRSQHANVRPSQLDDEQFHARHADRLRTRLLSRIEEIETSPDLVAIVSERGELAYVSSAAEEILGHTPESLSGLFFSDFVHTDNFHDFQQLLRDSFASKGTVAARVRARRQDGSQKEVWVWLDVRLRRMTERVEMPPGAVLVARDVTTQVELERAMELARSEADRANKAKTAFLSFLSHELRTPLTSILGYSQLLRDENGLQSESAEWVAQISKAGNHLRSLVDQLLDIARIESGRFDLALEHVSVSESVSSAMDLIRPMSDERDMSLRSELPPATELVVADRKALRQVLLNILSNAVKYGRPGGKITVGYERTSNVATIRISDNGPGIAAEQIPLLFRPFERLGAERTIVEGSGLGLAVSKSLVDAMGGDLRLENTDGEGATFVVELPAAPSNTAMPGGEVLHRAGSRGRGG
jgi:PAS domain S-box-containing protein